VSDSLSRRRFLLRSSAAVLAVPVAAVLGAGVASASSGLPGVAVRPRADWAQGLPAPQGLPREAPGDVKVLVVHHSASPNTYAPDDVPGVLRGFHALHTGPQKGWPDVAYNFFVDRYGTVWEGRAGSLDGPVRPDATGGSQGFAQICCFIGDHTTEPPTAEAQRSMTRLLAALADRYGVDPTGTTAFVSRGSNKWPAGSRVRTATIAGHRDLSLTTCPGEAAYPLVRDEFPDAVAALLAARAKPTPQSPPPPEPRPAPSTPAASSSAPAPATPAPPFAARSSYSPRSASASTPGAMLRTSASAACCACWASSGSSRCSRRRRTRSSTASLASSDGPPRSTCSTSSSRSRPGIC